MTLTSTSEHNGRTWQVIGPGRAGRVVVESLDEPKVTISVQVTSTYPLALIPHQEPAVQTAQAVKLDISTFERFASGHRFRAPHMNEWLSLPGLGGNAVMFVEGSTAVDDLVMYPGLHGLQVWFRSTWDNGKVMRLVECDILRVCPQCQVWPWCAWCKRFLLPVESHRSSRRHMSFRQRQLEMPRDDLRMEVLQNIMG